MEAATQYQLSFPFACHEHSTAIFRLQSLVILALEFLSSFSIFFLLGENIIITRLPASRKIRSEMEITARGQDVESHYSNKLNYLATVSITIQNTLFQDSCHIKSP